MFLFGAAAMITCAFFVNLLFLGQVRPNIINVIPVVQYQVSFQGAPPRFIPAGSNVADPNFSIQDPGSTRFRIPYSDPCQRKYF
jgi:hypothetical protein